MEVFILNEATQEQIDELGNKIKDLDGINTVKFKTKEQAEEFMKNEGDGEFLAYDDLKTFKWGIHH